MLDSINKYLNKLPVTYDGCQCICHKMDFVWHIIPCCGVKQPIFKMNTEDFEDSDLSCELFDREILGCTLINTCYACPEQYDVFLDGKQIGYLRLRHGTFRADYPDCGEETVYSDHPEGDGRFFDNERGFYLTEAVAALLKRHGRG